MTWLKLLMLPLILLCQLSLVEAGAPKKLVLLAQKPDGHPPLTHEYEPGLRILQTLLGKVPGLQTTLVRADEPWRKGPEVLKDADGAVVFLSEGAHWLRQDPKRLEAFQNLAKRGGGLSVIHWGMGTKEAKNIDDFTALFGACHGGPDRKYKVLAARGTLVAPKHPVLTGLKDFDVRDEFYYTLKRTKTGGDFQPLLNVDIDGSQETVCWGWQRPDKGRSFGFSGLHFHENWRMPEYRRLVLQGVAWTMNVAIPAEGLPIALGEKDLQVK